VTTVMMAVVNAVHDHGLGVSTVLQGVDLAWEVHLATDEETAAACPSSGVLSTSVKRSATIRPMDIAYGPDSVRLVWPKPRSTDGLGGGGR
jgi:transposase